MSQPSIFGTDGVRGQANAWPMTVETGVALGRAIAHAFRQGRERPRILIGKDTRISGYMFESALAAGVCAVGGEAYLMGPIPTPGVAFVTVSMRASAGVVISASHNPYQDNGIKFFGRDGYKLDDDLEARISGWVANQQTASFDVTGSRIGKAHRLEDVLGRYIVYLKSTFPKGATLEGLRVCIDCANGAAYKVAPAVFEELGARVITTGTEPDGTNINAGCGAMHPERLQRMVSEHGADVGIALDGDADRCIMVDERGEVVDGDQVLGLCAIGLKEAGRLARDTVVATVMSNLGLERALQGHGIAMTRCAVGDRHVVAALREQQLALGGEQSGHLIFLDHSTTGDGILTALQVLARMLQSGRPLSELARFYDPYPQILRNLRVADKPPLSDLDEVQAAIRSGEDHLGDDGRLMVRYSGTEPKVRVMGEGPDRSRVERVVASVYEALDARIGESD